PAEIHDHVAPAGHRLRIVRPYTGARRKVRLHVHARGDFEVGSSLSGRLDRAAHAPGGADQHDADHARAAAPSATPEARAASSTAFSVAGSIGTSGSRSSFSTRPISESRYLMGPGFDSRNAALKSGISFWCAASAAAGGPVRQRSVSSRICRGAACPTTETMPSPPTAEQASVSASSPESSVSLVSVFTSAIWFTSPDASFTALTLGRSCTIASVSGSVFVPVRPGTL